jgi:hypothetical protein
MANGSTSTSNGAPAPVAPVAHGGVALGRPSAAAVQIIPRQRPARFKLTPSRFAFDWEECPRCFYLDAVCQVPRPRTPLPRVFSEIDQCMKAFFDGLRTDEICPDLPSGVFCCDGGFVVSRDIELPGHTSVCYLSGRYDTVVRFDDPALGCAVVDFKTAESKLEHVGLYSRQLHAYGWALERAADRARVCARVSRLGLLCIQPNELVNIRGGGFGRYGRYHLSGALRWIECPRDDAAFERFLIAVMAVLTQPEPPPPSPDCPFCRYRRLAQRTGL